MFTGILEVTTHEVKEMFGLFRSCPVPYIYDCVIASCRYSVGMASRDPPVYMTLSAL